MENLKIRIYIAEDKSILKIGFVTDENTNESNYLEFDNMKSLMKELNINDINELTKYYMDGEIKKENLKRDENWNKVLMNSKLIREKHVGRLNKKIDKELVKTKPDPVTLFKLKKEIEDIENGKKFTRNDIKEIYEQALINLEEDGHDKPEVVKKIKSKIKEHIEQCK